MKQETQFSLFLSLITNQSTELVTLVEVYRLMTPDTILKENTVLFRHR